MAKGSQSAIAEHDAGFIGDELASTSVGEVVTGNQIQAGRKFLTKFGIDASELSDKEVVEKLNKIRVARARSVEVLSRGPTIDGIELILKKHVPKGHIGEFVLERDVDVSRAKAMGWMVLVDDKAKKDTPTGKADGVVRLGDCILMTMPEEDYIANRLVKLERLERRHKKTQAQAARDETSEWTIPVVEL